MSERERVHSVVQFRHTREEEEQQEGWRSILIGPIKTNKAKNKQKQPEQK